MKKLTLKGDGALCEVDVTCIGFNREEYGPVRHNLPSYGLVFNNLNVAEIQIEALTTFMLTVEVEWEPGLSEALSVPILAGQTFTLPGSRERDEFELKLENPVTDEGRVTESNELPSGETYPIGPKDAFNSPDGDLLTVADFARVNAQRSRELFGMDVVLGRDKDITFLLLALCGEAGEAANEWKKGLEQHAPGDADYASHNARRERIADELADVITYAVLGIQALGRDVPKTLIDKFNEVSARRPGGFKWPDPSLDARYAKKLRERIKQLEDIIYRATDVLNEEEELDEVGSH